MLIPLRFLMDPVEEQKGYTSSTRYVAQFILWFCLGFCDPFCMLGRTWSIQCTLSGEWYKEQLHLREKGKQSWRMIFHYGTFCIRSVGKEEMVVAALGWETWRSSLLD